MIPRLSKIFLIGLASLFIHACSHPIEIIGNGDVTSASGSRDCSLEEFQTAQDNCSKNYVVGEYHETYTAEPREGWVFDRWGNYCRSGMSNTCTLNVAKEAVEPSWGQVAPPLQAFFSRFKISGPVLPHSGMNFGYAAILADAGYSREEFFLTGIARSYAPTLPLPADGKVDAMVSPDSDDGSYKTRIVVVRPVDPTDFNGTVIVEWLNVTAGADTPPDFIMAHNEFIRSGYAYVAVSAQSVGVNALVASNARYESLLHPGDSYSYDLFTHVGKSLLTENSPLLGGLVPERLIATGESQSASRMVTYINVAHPLEQVYGGFMVHSRGSTGSSISQTPLPSIRYTSPVLIRDDLSVPVMVLMAEDDVLRSNLSVRQPDTPLFREWEMAGTAHADAYTILGLSDPGDGSVALRMFQMMRTPFNPFGCTNPMNAGPAHLIVQAAFDSLNTWVKTLQDAEVAAMPPAIGTPFSIAVEDPVLIDRDVHGNVFGGVRTPHVDAPVATINGIGSGPSFCRLFGSTIPLTTEAIVALYPTKADFLEQWTDALDASIEGGFLLPASAEELVNGATAWDFPN